MTQHSAGRPTPDAGTMGDHMMTNARRPAGRPGGDELVVAAEGPATVAGVWRSLTDERGAWWPDMEFEPVVGAPLREVWSEEGVEKEAHGRVIGVVAEHALTFIWSQPSWPVPLRVTFALEATSITSGCRVTVRETGFGGLPGGDLLRAEHAEGWAYHLARLLAHAEESAARDER